MSNVKKVKTEESSLGNKIKIFEKLYNKNESNQSKKQQQQVIEHNFKTNPPLNNNLPLNNNNKIAAKSIVNDLKNNKLFQVIKEKNQNKSDMESDRNIDNDEHTMTGSQTVEYRCIKKFENMVPSNLYNCVTDMLKNKCQYQPDLFTKFNDHSPLPKRFHDYLMNKKFLDKKFSKELLENYKKFKDSFDAYFLNMFEKNYSVEDQNEFYFILTFFNLISKFGKNHLVDIIKIFGTRILAINKLDDYCIDMLLHLVSSVEQGFVTDSVND